MGSAMGAVESDLLVHPVLVALLLVYMTSRQACTFPACHGRSCEHSRPLLLGPLLMSQLLDYMHLESSFIILLIFVYIYICIYIYTGN